MSGHLIGCVKKIDDLGRSQKLALVAFADSADDRTHIAFPGYVGVQEWATVSRARAAELIGDLVKAGYIQQHSTARPGRRAEYIVFPNGCCDLHRIPDTEPDDIDLEALAAAVGVSQDQVRELLQLAANRDDTPADTPTTADQPNGSEVSDTSPRNGSEISDPSGQDTPEGQEWVRDLGQRVRDLGLEHTNESTNGSENVDPFSTSNTNTPLPQHTDTGCAAHPDGPHASCRACGTSPRKRRAAAEQAARTAAGAAARAAARQLPLPVDPMLIERTRLAAAAAKAMKVQAT